MKKCSSADKQIGIDNELHAPFKSYCSGIEKRSVKSVTSDIIREKLKKENFKVK